ncbi:hypothetical protein [Effusibacillus pohliae]|uniref:hypothetical protein n=1 Tax=Effusibacillus pohliae TaxID=232270 RepID=UPI0012E9DF40|nr:hypothetical protein [Effusibacillus pohliae]
MEQALGTTLDAGLFQGVHSLEGGEFAWNASPSLCFSAEPRYTEKDPLSFVVRSFEERNR